MATENKCSGLKVLDPVQGLVDYIDDIKPYHTKIVEVLVEYVYGEALDVTIDEYIHTRIDMFRPETDDIQYSCERGYGLLPWGAPLGGWLIVPPNQTLSAAEYNSYPAFDSLAGTITIPGDRSDDIRPGDRVEIVAWIENPALLSPNDNRPDTSGVFNKTFNVSAVEYDAGSIPEWPNITDSSTYRLGVGPHTVITLAEGFGPLPLPLPYPDDVYIAMIRLAPVEIERVYSYSNAKPTYDPTSLDFSQTPDEGYLRKNIEAVVLSSLDGFGVAIPDTGKLVVTGNLLPSNIFVGDKVSVYESTGNNGQFTIASLVYDAGDDQTTIGVVERIREIVPDGIIHIDVPSNVFVVDGDYSSRFRQGRVFNVTGGSFSGEFTTLTSDYVNGKTRIRPTTDIVSEESGFEILSVASGFVIRGDNRSKFASGNQANVVGSLKNDGAYTVVSSTYDSANNQTEVLVCSQCGSPLIANVVDSAPGGWLVPVQMGVVKEAMFGFSETSDLCITVPEMTVHVSLHENLTFDGLGMSLADDLIVYNMENADTWGYELPLSTIRSEFPPMIMEQPTPPAVANLNDLWFNTSLPGTSPYNLGLHRYVGLVWQPISTVYWLEGKADPNPTSPTHKVFLPGFLHYRTKTNNVDTGWVLYLAEPPGFADVQPAISETRIIGQETFSAEEVAPGVLPSSFEFNTLSYSVVDVADGALSGTEDYIVVNGNVHQDANGIDLDVGVRTLQISGTGVNDGQYTISHTVYIAGDDQTRIFVEENIPVAASGGTVVIGPLTVPTSGSPLDTSLIAVTVNGVPADITLLTPTEFQINSPDYSSGDTIVARVFNTGHHETNALVLGYGGSVPHNVFHDRVTTTTAHSNRSYTLLGGNYVHRMIPQNRMEIIDFHGGGLLDIQKPLSIGVRSVEPVTHEIAIDGLYGWFFTSDIIMSVLMSDGTITDLTVVSSTELTNTTIIEVDEFLIVSSNSPTYENVFGAVYDRNVDHSNSNDNVKTYVIPSALAANEAINKEVPGSGTPYNDADGISYLWHGPLRIDIAAAYQNTIRSAWTDGLGASNELFEVPDRYRIIDTDATANTIRIHYDDPLTGLPVNLSDSFTPGTIFRIAGSQGELEHQTNNYQYVALSAVWEEGTTGDVVITVDDNFDNLPPYYELDVISVTNTGGPASNESQITVTGNLSGIVNSYHLDTGNAVIRFDQPIIDSWGPQNATTITRVDYTGGTTTFTFDTDIDDEAFTGALGFALGSFIGGLYYDSTANSWDDGYILREAVQIDSTPDSVAETTINENLDFGWGMTHRWNIVNTDAANNYIFVAGDVTSVLDPDDTAIVTGSQGNDGHYEIESFVYLVGPNETQITVRNPDLSVDPPAGLEGYFQMENIDVTGWYQYLIKEANSTTNVFTVLGNATLDVQSGMEFRVFGTQNDGIYTVTSSPTYDVATNTTELQVASISTDENGGWIESHRDYGIRLVLEDVVGIGVAENADAALILTSGSLIGAFDYTYFDIGSLDENAATVLHLYGNSF